MYKCDLCIDRSKDGIPPMCSSVCPTNTLQWLTDEEIENKRQAYNMDNGKWVTSAPYLENETNVRVNLPGIIQGITKLF